MEPHFEELAGRITTDVTEAVTARLTELIAAAEQQFSAVNLDLLTAAEQRLVQTNLEALTAAEQRLVQTTQNTLAAAEQRLSAQAQVNVEAVQYEARLAAEGYGATLESIERELKAFRSEWRAKAEDTDRILADHASRIS